MVIPVTAFVEAMKSIHFKKSFKSSDGSSEEGSELSYRAESAFDLIKNLIQLKSNNKLVISLPAINSGPGKHNNNRLSTALRHSKFESGVDDTIMSPQSEDDNNRIHRINPLQQ